ncbi:MAG TPA: NAD(P)H-binding protein, partial [Acidimicrobiales bacterium]|nr:NAD(P)H-binding protein [Acidimicrobiales bacterium]
MAPNPTVLVAGASGYVGSRLVPELLTRGHPVRCLARTPQRLDAAPWHDDVEIVRGDVGGDLSAAMTGAGAAVFLVHSIGEGHDWTARERRHAENFRDAAAAAGVGRIVYVGGLGDDRAQLSDHLRSRHLVGEVLADGPVPVTELRAAVVIGSGSASFEMLRYLTEVLPVMVTPKWVRSQCQPIAIADLLRYLVAAIEAPEPVHGVLEIGGPDVVTYADMMGVYAEEAGLAPRVLIPVPVLSPWLSSHWVGLVTPVPASLARPLVGSLVNDVVVTDDRAARTFPFARTGFRDAVRHALGPDEAAPTDPEWSGGTELTDVRTQVVAAPPAQVWRA